jgi:Lipocalin-like domain
MFERRALLAIAAGLAPALLSPAPAASADKADRPATLRDRLVGAWALQHAETVEIKTGKTSPWEGKPGPYSGLILYSPSGMMGVHIASPRAAVAEDVDFAKMPDAARLAYLDSYYAYFGTYEVDEANSKVRHHVQSALDPSEIGLVYSRAVTLEGDLLKLQTDLRPALVPPTTFNRLTWKRS